MGGDNETFHAHREIFVPKVLYVHAAAKSIVFTEESVLASWSHVKMLVRRRVRRWIRDFIGAIEEVIVRYHMERAGVGRKCVSAPKVDIPFVSAEPVAHWRRRLSNFL